MSYLLERLKEKSTYQGMLMLLGGLHYHFTSIAFEEFLGIYMIGVGLVEIFANEKTRIIEPLL